MQAHLLHPVLRVEQDGHLAMAFDAGHRVDGDPAQALGLGGGFKRMHGVQS